jgi:hypothetical protein
MGERLLKLIHYSLSWVQRAQDLLTILRPVNASMLLTSAGNTFDLVKRAILLSQTLKHEIHRLQPHRNWSVDFSFLLVDVNSLLDAIL